MLGMITASRTINHELKLQEMVVAMVENASSIMSKLTRLKVGLGKEISSSLEFYKDSWYAKSYVDAQHAIVVVVVEVVVVLPTVPLKI